MANLDNQSMSTRSIRPTSASILPQPIQLESSVSVYLNQFGQAVRKDGFGTLNPAYERSLGEHGEGLVQEARSFDDQAVRIIGQSRLVVDERMRPFLDQINRETKRTAEDPSFTEVVIDYYVGLRAEIERVLRRVSTEGPSYLMDGFRTYKEEAVLDVAALLKMFFRASGEVHSQLYAKSPEYRNVEAGRVERFLQLWERNEGAQLSEEDFCMAERRMIVSGIGSISEMLEAGDPDAPVSGNLLLVTNDLLHYLGENTGQKNLKKLGRPGACPLDSLPGGPLEQLRSLVALLNSMASDYQDCVVTHRNLLLEVK